MINKIYLILTILVAVNTINLYAQCGCPGNSGSVGIIPLSELSNIDSLIMDNLFVNIFYKNIYADTYYNHDSKIGEGPIKKYSANYLSLRVGYKPTNRWHFESEIGYFANKTADYGFLGKEKFNGLSDLTFYTRYIAYKNLENGLDISIGTGFKIPLSTGDTSIPQNIQSSTGGYAVLFNFIAKEVIPSINSGIILAHRSDINFNNRYDYRYGNSFITSLFFLNNIYENTVIGLEIKNDIRMKDYNHDIKLDESGMISITISPVVRYSIGDLVLNFFFDYPVYQYYNTLPAGQIGNKYSFGLGISYNTRL